MTHEHAGVSINELIDIEWDRAEGDYRRGIGYARSVIKYANEQGRKPMYALKEAWAKACAKGESAEYRRGIQTVQFIFNTPYKWIQGERP